jgi:CAAX protease family protein
MSADRATASSGAGLRGLLTRHPLVSFFVLAYAGAWLTWLPIVLSEDGAGVLPFSSPLTRPSLGGGSFLQIAGVFAGPALAGFIMTGATEGRAGVGRLLRRFVLWRVALRWYLLVLIGPAVVVALGTIVLPGATTSFRALDSIVPDPMSVLTYLVMFALVLVLGGPLGEEPGWRGFALPRLQGLHGPLLGSLILGSLWAFWHLPLNFIPSWGVGFLASGGGARLIVLSIVIGLVNTVAFTIVLTWVFNNTFGSLLMVILLHTCLDTYIDSMGGLFPTGTLLGLPAGTLVGLPAGTLVGLGTTLGFVVLALVLVVVTRGRLGYEEAIAR